MPRPPFDCRRCGHCCRALVDAYRGCVSDGDLDRWRRAGRTELLAMVTTLDLGRGNLLHLAWIDPESGEEVDACPWLETDPQNGTCSCSIHDVRPDHCRAFPEHRRHAEATGCPGYLPRASSTGSRSAPE